MSEGRETFMFLCLNFYQGSLLLKTEKERRNHNVIRIAFLREHSYTVGDNINWCSHCGKIVWRFLRKLIIELPYEPAIPLLGIHPDEIIIQKDTRSPTFIAALFTIAKTCK